MSGDEMRRMKSSHVARASRPRTSGLSRKLEGKMPSPRNMAISTSLRQLTDQILTEESDLRQGGGATGQARQRKLGRLPVRERIELLLDKGSSLLESGLWAAYGMYSEVGGAVAAGVVTGVGRVHDRPVMVVANDASV